MTNRTRKAVEEFYSSSTIAPLLDIKAEDMQNFCYQHKIKTKVYDDGNESKIFVSGESLQDYLGRSKASDQAHIALKLGALKRSMDSKDSKRINRKPKEKKLLICTEIPEGFVSTREAARMLGVEMKSLYYHINKGILEAKKIKTYNGGCGFKYVVSISSCENYNSKYNAGIPEGFVSTREAARMLKLSSRYIYQLCKKGNLESKKVLSKIGCAGFRYIVSIRSCEDYKNKLKIPQGFVDTKEAARMLGISPTLIRYYIDKGNLENKKILSGRTPQGYRYIVSIRSCEDWMKKGERLQKTKTKKGDKINQDNNPKLSYKLPPIDLYLLSNVVDLDTLALVYPELRDWLAESRNATIREFIVDTIKQMGHLQKITNMENKNVITK